jgi:iron complex transport system substrate-binding protein
MRRLNLTLPSLVFVLVAACSTGRPPATTATPQPATPQPATALPAPEFPLTVTDDDGTQVTIPAEPQTIVSLTPANTEIVYALGAGDRMRGGTDFDDYPPEAAALPDVVTGIAVQVEQIVDIDPDLVLAGGNNFTPTADVDRLRSLGIEVIVVYPETVDEVLADINLIGQALGRHDQAVAMTAAMDDRISEVVDAVAALGEPRTFYEIGYGPDIYGPAPDSFVADMVELAGGDAITTTDPAVFTMPLERLVDEDPEVVVLGDAAYGTCPDSVPGRPGWDGMTAVEEGAVRPVDDIVVTRPGPRLAEGLAALALAIHPDANIAPPQAGATLCGVTEATPAP